MNAPVRHLAMLLFAGCSVTTLSLPQDGGDAGPRETAPRADRPPVDTPAGDADVPSDAQDERPDAPLPSPRDPPDGAVTVTLDEPTRSCASGEHGCGRAWVRGGVAVPYPVTHEYSAHREPLGTYGSVGPRRVGGFILDRNEVTVRRFRRFWLAGMPQPKQPIRYPGGLWPWPVSNLVIEPMTEARCRAMGQSAGCGSDFTWSRDDPRHDDLPIIGISIVTAQSFCVWDGGRLPTEVEWFYAAYCLADERPLPRIYAWGNEAPCDRDNVGIAVEPLPDGPQINCTPSQPPIEPVGARPANGAFYGLDGNVPEVVADSYFPWFLSGSTAPLWREYPETPDPLYIYPRAYEWVVRGGGVRHLPGSRSILALGVDTCAPSHPECGVPFPQRLCTNNCSYVQAYRWGFRCAYDPPTNASGSP